MQNKLYEDGQALYLAIIRISGRNIVREIILSEHGFLALTEYLKSFLSEDVYKNYYIDGGEIAGIEIKVKRGE